MSFRKLIVSAMILGTITLVFFALWLPSPSAINDENFANVHRGMTLQEVEEILGGPARDEISGAKYVQWLPVMPFSVCKRSAEWIGPNAAVFVGFDSDNRVVCKGRGIVGFYDTPIHRIRRLLGL